MRAFMYDHFDKLIIVLLLLLLLRPAAFGNTWAQGEVHGLTEALLALTVGAGVRAAIKKENNDGKPDQ